MSSLIDTSNSTTEPLENGSTFNGSPRKISDLYQGSLITCKTDQNGILTVEWSDDLIHWDFSATHNIAAGIPYKCQEQNLGTFIKVSLENNSGSDQTYLRLMTRFISDIPDANVDTFTSQILWSGQLIVNTNYTPTIDLLNTNGNVDLFGNLSDSGALTIQVSDDDNDWYNAYVINASSSGNIHARIETACRFLRCVYAGPDNTITLICNAK